MPAIHPAGPAEQIVDLLMEARDAGAPFERAWRSAIDLITWPAGEKARGEWRRALAWAKHEFRDAYGHPEGQGPALMRIFDEPDEAAVEHQAREMFVELCLDGRHAA